jgi:hypothetical protein
MTQSPSGPGRDDGPPHGRHRLGALAIPATTFIGALAITGDVASAVVAVTSLAGLAR